MKKFLIVLLAVLTLGALFLAGCGETTQGENPGENQGENPGGNQGENPGDNPGDGGDETVTYALTTQADEGVTLTVTQNGTAVSGKLEAGKEATVTATVEAGTVDLYVNEEYQTSPYTFVPAADTSVRAEHLYPVHVKVENPNKVNARSILLKQDGKSVTLTARLEYETNIRVGTTVEFVVSSAGYYDETASVLVDGEETVTITLDRQKMEGVGGDGWGSNVTETADGEFIFGPPVGWTNAYIFKGERQTHWAMSFKVKDLEPNASYGFLMFGAVIDYVNDGNYLTMNLRYQPGAGEGDTVLYCIEIVHTSYSILDYYSQSTVDLKEVVDEVKNGEKDSFAMEFIRDDGTFYLFINGTIVVRLEAEQIEADMADTASAAFEAGPGSTLTPIEGRGSGFGLFARESLGFTVFDLSVKKGEEAISERLAQGVVTLPTPTATNGTVTIPEGVYYRDQIVHATLTPEDGYMLESVTYGGEDKTSEVEGGVFSFYADPDKTLNVTFKEIPATAYTVKGHIDVKTYGEQIPYTAIQVTSNNGEQVTVDDEYNYSVLAEEETELTLTFTAGEYFTGTSCTFTVTGETGEDVVIDEPVLKTWAASFTKTGHNEYTVATDPVSTFNPTNFQGVSTKYFIIESKVTITAATADYGFGFTTYGSSAILASLSGGVWYAEIICENPVWTLQRQALSAELSQVMTTAAANGTPVTLKAVRADNVLALFINNTYAGSFLTTEFVGIPTIGANEATTVGLYERGGAAGKFENVWYDLNQANAEAAVAGVQPVMGTERSQDWGINNQGDGSIATADAGALALGGYIGAGTYWVIQATVSGVQCKNGNQAYVGFLVDGGGQRSIHLVYDADAQTYGVELSGWGGATIKNATLQDGVNLQEKLTALVNGGTISLKMVRLANDIYVFVDGSLVAKVAFTEFGDLSSVNNSIGYSAKKCSCKFSDYSYTFDRLAVAQALAAANG